MQNYKYFIACLACMLCVQIGIAQTKPLKVKPANNTQRQAVVAEQKFEALKLGRYELYSGIPSIYLGHFILLENGKYKVAFDTDEDDYDVSGSYVFHPETQTIEWTAGMFKNNNWGGKFVKKENKVRIQFNKASFGELAGK